MFAYIWSFLQLIANGVLGTRVPVQNHVGVEPVQKLERRLSLKPTEEHVLDLQLIPRLATRSNVLVCPIFKILV